MFSILFVDSGDDDDDDADENGTYGVIYVKLSCAIEKILILR